MDFQQVIFEYNSAPGSKPAYYLPGLKTPFAVT